MELTAELPTYKVRLARFVSVALHVIIDVSDVVIEVSEIENEYRGAVVSTVNVKFEFSAQLQLLELSQVCAFHLYTPQDKVLFQLVSLNMPVIFVVFVIIA